MTISFRIYSNCLHKSSARFRRFTVKPRFLGLLLAVSGRAKLPIHLRGLLFLWEMLIIEKRHLEYLSASPVPLLFGGADHGQG